MTRKDKFLELVKKIRQTQVTERLYSARNSEELKNTWEEFKKGNLDLISEIREWERDFLETERKCALFIEYETIEDSMEVGICIRLMKRAGIETWIFEDCDDLSKALSKINQNLAKAASYLFCYYTLHDIEAKELFGESIYEADE